MISEKTEKEEKGNKEGQIQDKEYNDRLHWTIVAITLSASGVKYHN